MAELHKPDQSLPSDADIATVWRAAMTAACNVIIKRQNDLNDEDGPTEVLNEQGQCIHALKKWIEPDEVYLEELREILGYQRTGLPERIKRAETRVAELEALINSPQTNDWLKGAQLEAAHQIERWGAQHDAGKSAWDWFWLIGYLAQKAAAAQVAGDAFKAKHHTISTAAALLNWHRHLAGTDQRMRPGIDPVARGVE
jgi:hypothetical protein